MTETAAHKSIPVLETGPGFPVATLEARLATAQALIDDATRHVPRRALAMLDAVSRRWLVRARSPHLAEIDHVARLLARPGAYFLSVNYEWGCTVRVGPAPDGQSARIARVLDWATPGLGRHIVAAHVKSPAGRFLTLTWPGYTGVLQGMAPGRFSAALNQAPMARSGGGLLPLDWAVNRSRVWRSDALTPAHLLREVFETASTFAAAKNMIIHTPIASPAIFSLAGVSAEETCVIERRELTAHVHSGSTACANHWQAPGWRGRARGVDSHGRLRDIRASEPLSFNPDFAWLTWPILNKRTRLVMIADAARGRVLAQGYEASGPATAVLDWSAAMAKSPRPAFV